MPRKEAVRIRIHRDLCRIAGPDTANIILKDLRKDPHLGEIGESVESGRRFDIHIGKSTVFSDVPRGRRVEC